MWNRKDFILPTECVDLLDGILTSINKEAISTAIYNLMDAKVSANLSFGLLQGHCVILSITIFVVQNQERFCLHCFIRNARELESTLQHFRFIQELQNIGIVRFSSNHVECYL